MRVIYRVTSIPSTNPSPIFQEDKNRLNKLCLDSFVEFFREVKPEVIFLADHCNCQEMLSQIPFDHKIISSDVGINQTMLDSYNLACEVEDFVLFQECDYLYNGNKGKTFLRALEQLELVSPYDHLNFYKDKSLHSEECKIKLVDGHHFRTTERNTMTWGCHSSLVKENKDILDREGYLDGPVWYELKARGYDLHVPIPSMATHMVRDYLAPNVDWESLWLNTL